MSKKVNKTNNRARFGLSHPDQLLAKLNFDIERMRLAEAESRGREVIFAAMDCAVTIVAIKDWTRRYRKLHNLPVIDFHKAIPRFAVANEIANGMKHYTVENPFAKETGYFSGSAFFTKSGGQPTKIPHFIFVGWDSDTFNPRETFEGISAALKSLFELQDSEIALAVKEQPASH